MKKLVIGAVVCLAGAFAFFRLQEPLGNNVTETKSVPPFVENPIDSTGNQLTTNDVADPDNRTVIPGLAPYRPNQAILSETDRKLIELGKNGRLQEAVSFIHANYTANRKNAALRVLLGNVGSTNLDSISVLLPHFTEKSERQVAFGMISQQMIESRNGVEPLINYAETKMTGDIKNEIFFQCISSATNARRWEIGSKLIDQMPFSSARTAAINNLAAGYGQSNPNSALQWASQLALPEDRVSAQSAVLNGMAIHGDTGALVEAMPSLDPAGRGAAGNAIGKLSMQQNLPLSDLLEQERKSPNSAAPILLGAISAATPQQLESLLPEFDKLSSGTTRNRAAAHIASKMFSNSQTESINWALGLKGEDREPAIRAIVSKWYNTDSMQLSDWVNGLKNVGDQDAAKEAIVQMLRASDKDAARQLAATINDKQRRDRASGGIR